MMQPSSPSARVGLKFMLVVRDGPDSGANFQLLPPRVTIGRGADCHVALSDPRVSRNAAVIEFSVERILVTDVSNRGQLMVNNEFTESAALKDGDVIRIGESEMTFFVEAIKLAPSRPMQIAPKGTSSEPRVPNGFGTGPSKRQRFYIIVTLAGLAFTGLMLMDGKKTKKDSGPRTVEELEKEIKISQDKQNEIIKKRVFKNDDERTRYEEAQKHFGEGFRDYQKGQWVRAMRSFETAVTIDPQHQLARRYFKLSEKARDAMISDLILEGRRYREKGMWSRCSAQFEKVLDMISNHEDMKYKSAEALKKECDLQLKWR